MRRPGLEAALAALVSIAAPRLSHGQPSAPPTPDATALEEAKDLFRQGNELRRAGDCQRALELYLASRKRVPSVYNVMNSAVCLAQLGRYDEALEDYERVLAEFRAEITDDERATIAAETARLRGKVGSVDVLANVQGSLVIDGRARGQLPLVAPVRLMPGRHLLRIVKEGYQTFERNIDVVIGQTAVVDARLSPLKDTGRLRVDEATLAGGDLFVDGALVGKVPWEGTLAAGQHTWFVHKGDNGTAIQRLVVVEGHTAVGRAALSPLGGAMLVDVGPASATLFVDGVRVGRGRWEGRLPVGRHELLAREEGYRDARRVVVVGRGAGTTLAIELEVDSAHPRWGVDRAQLLLDVFGGPAFAPTFGSGAEQSCGEAATCTSDPMAAGLLAGARVGYELPFGLAIEGGAGYLRVSKELERTRPETFGESVPSSYALVDELRFSGPFAVAGIAYRASFAGDLLELRTHLDFGLVIVDGLHRSRGTATANGATVAAGGLGADSVVSADVFVLPGAQLGLRHRGWGVALGLDVGLFTLSGPQNGLEEIRVDPTGCVSPEQIQCASGESFVDGERTYGRFLLLVPTLTVGYALVL